MKSSFSLTKPLRSCLLVAQDREEIYLVIGEWDALYEEYALQGKFSNASHKVLEELKAMRDPASDDAGFLTLHVYGPFGGYSGLLSSRSGSMRKLSANLLALSLHLSQASCSPSSRRISPAGSIQLPTPRGAGKPCCAGCTCNCRCKKTTSSRDPSKSESDTSESQRGRREDSRDGSRPRDPSTKRTPSRPSQDSLGRDSTPTRDPRAGAKRPGAASARDQSVHRHAQGQAHENLPLRGRPTATDQQASSSDAPVRTGRSKSRGRDAAVPGHHEQVPAPAGNLQRPPPLPEASGAPGQAAGQRQQQQPQRPPHAQEGRGTQQQRDPRRAPTIPGPQQSQEDPFGGAGPSRQPQAGQSSVSTPPGPAVTPGRRGPSQPQRDPGETPVKKNRKLKNVFGFGKKKDEDDKK